MPRPAGSACTWQCGKTCDRAARARRCWTRRRWPFRPAPSARPTRRRSLPSPATTAACAASALRATASCRWPAPRRSATMRSGASCRRTSWSAPRKRAPTPCEWPFPPAEPTWRSPPVRRRPLRRTCARRAAAARPRATCSLCVPGPPALCATSASTPSSPCPAWPSCAAPTAAPTSSPTSSRPSSSGSRLSPAPPSEAQQQLLQRPLPLLASAVTSSISSLPRRRTREKTPGRTSLPDATACPAGAAGSRVALCRIERRPAQTRLELVAQQRPLARAALQCAPLHATVFLPCLRMHACVLLSLRVPVCVVLSCLRDAWSSSEQSRRLDKLGCPALRSPFGRQSAHCFRSTAAVTTALAV
mmetsp:Transcript_540/g.2126  ORF Transcript_540/g.2126 Transcript_540/m.2126 type:complete len:360 (-) Transcript_540:503-1582(-)